MIRSNNFFRFMALALLFASQIACSDAASVKGDIVAAEQAWKLIQQGALVVDVRSAEEFETGHLEDAVNIPHTELDQLAELIGDDLDRNVVFYCRSGGRASRAIAVLEERGYTAIFNGTGYEALMATKP